MIASKCEGKKEKRNFIKELSVGGRGCVHNVTSGHYL